ncbi:stress responsive A/B barrel domain protein [Diplogelasinospora grovesii]|uniref:Stress responsive A/B barrel domain protein n=1 Tax=Diplogelasinospora grovesii TaxID=303347 RepID=A0AAN6S0X2_9PEZI|nr:stress responsive A/B barrel domain protein [Diplogelasinospora grovesii]
MAIVHTVMFSFKPLIPREEVDGVCERMLALKDNCLHPQTNKPYVKMAMGGIDNSPEGMQEGITHVFVSEFESDADRKYYLEEDKAHLAFVNSIEGIVEKAQVVDFSPGVFTEPHEHTN